MKNQTRSLFTAMVLIAMLALASIPSQLQAADKGMINKKSAQLLID